MKKRLCLIGVDLVKNDLSKDLSEIEKRVNLLAKERGLSARVEWGAEDPTFSKSKITPNPFGPDYAELKEGYPLFYYTGASWIEIRDILEDLLSKDVNLKNVNRLFFS